MKTLAGKLDKPPYVHNWVRNIYPEQAQTVKSLVKLALGFPQITYSAGQVIIRDCLTLGTTKEDALRAAALKGRVNSRAVNTDYVKAFLEYRDIRGYTALSYVDDSITPYRFDRNHFVPVKPLATLIENGNFNAIFSVGWARNTLTEWQRRVLATVIEETVFTLRDYRRAKGEFLCFPRLRQTDGALCRSPEVWQRGDYQIFSFGEMRDIARMYLAALSEAKLILADMPAKESVPRRSFEHPSMF